MTSSWVRFVGWGRPVFCAELPLVPSCLSGRYLSFRSRVVSGLMSFALAYCSK
ncbi:hypothetical protein HOLleu_20900 [Holothuria leucospilota]|uniref:Uncharacterized protein n=1 Tax=Holothuria leucospilota TaxID=206669 RepID=A0A9Q1BX33_HOLLE|nr:hypothetical protein HOLleu_20900 [Holothuria leucospilota]